MAALPVNYRSRMVATAFDTKGSAMIIKTKSRIAIAALIDVAAHEGIRPVTLAGVAERRGFSLSYLELLFKHLRQCGIVSSTRGPGGGYRLNKDLSTITVAEIIAAVDGERLENCVCTETVAGRGSAFHSLWCRVNHHMHDYLTTVTLASVIAQVGAGMGNESTTPLPQQRATAQAPVIHH
jgi:Rrf2 family transcriptional regulator, iron-sulfur cluster assembly transcription factor